jgi:uncharacterized membrane protein
LALLELLPEAIRVNEQAGTGGSDGEVKNRRRCMAAISGGAIAGAITGAAIGSVVPVIGNIGCGIIGAFGGALGGWGTASPCDEEEEDDDD